VGNVMERWGNRFADALRDSDASLTRNGAYGTLSRTIRLVIQMAVLGIGAWLVLAGQMTAGMIFAASMVSGRALQPLDQIVGAWRQVADARTAWDRISATLKATAAARAEKVNLPAPKGALQLEQVIYYPPNAKPGARALVKGANITINAGETVAIIGPSQAGKSTLARLIVGAIRPHSGTVRIDGADIATWEPDQLGRHVGYLSQEVELLPGTIAQNIARFDAEPAEGEILAAAQRAMVHELVLAQKDGYGTEIGPGGVRLSGGERQRVGLARAFYGNPKLIVLDEPNANLDSEGEAALERAIVQAREQQATVLIITHRPSLAAKCDRIIYMRGGAIELFGPAADVLKRLAETAARPAAPAAPPPAAPPPAPQPPAAPAASPIPEGVRMSPGVVMLQTPQQRGK
jgi:PrtD family type I secretion system ABC transporter